MAEINICETREKLLKNRENATAFLAAQISKHPDMVKATKDIELIDQQLAKLDDLEKAQKEEQAEKDLNAAVKEAIALFDEGKEPEDDEIAAIAEKFNLEVEVLEDAIADELGKGDE